MGKNSLAFICNKYAGDGIPLKRRIKVDGSTVSERAAKIEVFARKLFRSYQHNDSSHQCLSGGGK